MAASNWFQQIWDETGKALNTDRILFEDRIIEFYKNYCYILDANTKRDIPLVNIMEGCVSIRCGDIEKEDNRIEILMMRTAFGKRDYKDDLLAIVETYQCKGKKSTTKRYVIASGYAFDRCDEHEDDCSWDGAYCIKDNDINRMLRTLHDHEYVNSYWDTTIDIMADIKYERTRGV